MDTSLRRTLSTGPEGVGLTESSLYVHTLPWFPRKSRPIKLGKVYTRPKRLKTLPFGAAHTYIAYIR